MFRALLSPILLAAFSLQQQPSASPPAQEHSTSPIEPGRPDQGAIHIDKSVTPPVLLYSVQPEFSKKARKAKFGGKVQVYLWVEKDGLPSHVRVIRGVGMGLDENAVTAISQYRFKPAMQNGKPVVVDIYIDVNFIIKDGHY